MNRILVFTDGASSGNPGPGGWGSIVLLPNGEVTELGGSAKHTTNNRMELAATIEALLWITSQDSLKTPKKIPIQLYTDSTYVIRGITQWVSQWVKRGWISTQGTEIANSDLWKALAEAASGLNISWNYVKGHAGVPGNERVDEIAVSFSKGKKPRLYEGPLSKYEIKIEKVATTPLPKGAPSSAKSSKAFSYLSVVNGIPMRHSTWADCEKRVKGQSGAKFKKAMTPLEEEAILETWGLDRRHLKN